MPEKFDKHQEWLSGYLKDDVFLLDYFNSSIREYQSLEVEAEDRIGYISVVFDNIIAARSEDEDIEPDSKLGENLFFVYYFRAQIYHIFDKIDDALELYQKAKVLISASTAEHEEELNKLTETVEKEIEKRRKQRIETEQQLNNAILALVA